MRPRRLLAPVLAVAVTAAGVYGLGKWQGWWVRPTVADPPAVVPAAVEPVTDDQILRMTP